MAVVTARSKKMDQSLISRAELHKVPGNVTFLNTLVNSLEGVFKAATIGIFGRAWFTRLVNTANRRNVSPIVYTINVLLK